MAVARSSRILSRGASPAARRKGRGRSRDLSEDLYRYSASVSDDLPESWDEEEEEVRGGKQRRKPDPRDGIRLTRFEERSIKRSRMAHLVQFLCLLGLLLLLLGWLAYTAQRHL